MERGWQLLIGTYTERLPHVDGNADGILATPYDPADGRMGDVVMAARTRSPSWIAVDEAADRVYAVNESSAADGGTVTAFRRDPRAGALEPLNTVPSGGSGPCHLIVHPSSGTVLVANFGSGTVAAIGLTADGELGDQLSLARHDGRGPDPEIQTGPHAHQVCVDPVTGDLLVPDLGIDAVLAYRIIDGGKLSELPHRIRCQPGDGPRHLAFHPGGGYAFVLNQLSNTVVSLRRTGDGFEPVHRASTLPEWFRGRSDAAAIRVSPSGRLVLASNRGHDSIALLRFDAATGELGPAAWVPTGGRGPRDFCLSPDGRFVHAANQDSDTITHFTLDEAAATMHPYGQTVAATPVCLTFVPALTAQRR